LDQSNDYREIPDEGRSFGQILIFFLVVVVALVVIVGPVVGLFILGDEDMSALERLRDTAIVLMGIVWLIILILLSVMVFVMVWVAFQIKNRALPMLEEILANVRNTSGEATETVKRARGTIEFVSERAASPVISTLATVARWRATARMFVTGKDKKRS
jgi:type VI protein secretion system component VasK